jgi:hypothetical protein
LFVQLLSQASKNKEKIISDQKLGAWLDRSDKICNSFNFINEKCKLFAYFPIY